MLIFVALGNQRHIGESVCFIFEKNLENSNRRDERWHSSLVLAISIRDIQYKCGALSLSSVRHSRASSRIRQ